MIRIKRGEEIIITAIAERNISSNNKVTWKHSLISLSPAFYCGYTYKQEGQIKHDIYSEGSEYYLDRDNSVFLIRVKFHERSNDTFVFPEDIQHLSYNWELEVSINSKTKRREIVWR